MDFFVNIDLRNIQIPHESDPKNKYCQATFDTLELCQALSSKKNAVGEEFKLTLEDNQLKINDRFKLKFNPSNLTANLPGGGGNSGGGIKTRKNKKPRKQNKIKTRKNQY